MMTLPGDAVLLLGVVNSKLRDFYADLDALCDDMGASRDAIEQKLEAIGYVYDSEQNRFL